jgi:hypothetical protein
MEFKVRTVLDYADSIKEKNTVLGCAETSMVYGFE